MINNFSSTFSKIEQEKNNSTIKYIEINISKVKIDNFLIHWSHNNNLANQIWHKLIQIIYLEVDSKNNSLLIFNKEIYKQEILIRAKLNLSLDFSLIKMKWIKRKMLYNQCRWNYLLKLLDCKTNNVKKSNTLKPINIIVKNLSILIQKFKIL